MSTGRTLKIYFAGSIRGGHSDAALYRELIGRLKSDFGAVVLTEHIGAELSELENKIEVCRVARLDRERTVAHHFLPVGQSEMTDKDIHDQDVAWLREADVLIAEVRFGRSGCQLHSRSRAGHRSLVGRRL